VARTAARLVPAAANSSATLVAAIAARRLKLLISPIVPHLAADHNRWWPDHWDDDGARGVENPAS
jgi:hypothetical protein